MRSLLFAFTWGLVSFMSCTMDKFETDPCASVSYTETIRPLVASRCALPGCHVSGFQPGDFSDYAVLKQKVEKGTLQLMVLSLNNMPPSDKLSEEEKALLQCWIQSGATDD